MPRPAQVPNRPHLIDQSWRLPWSLWNIRHAYIFLHWSIFSLLRVFYIVPRAVLFRLVLILSSFPSIEAYLCRLERFVCVTVLSSCPNSESRASVSLSCVSHGNPRPYHLSRILCYFGPLSVLSCLIATSSSHKFINTLHLTLILARLPMSIFLSRSLNLWLMRHLDLFTLVLCIVIKRTRGSISTQVHILNL